MCCSDNSAPPAPDYTALAQADEKIAGQQMDLAREQMAQSKSEFDTEWPYAQKYLDQQTQASAQETSAAKDAQQFYDSTYKPIEKQFADTASNYNSPARADQNAGQAMADVSSSFDQSRTTALSNLESYGIDPSQTRFGALDLGTRISQAAASAGADTQSRLNTQATGLALQGEAINVGRGYSSAIANSYNTASNSGSSGFSAMNGVIATGNNGNATASGIMGAAANANAGAIGAMHQGYADNLAGAQFNAQQSANQSSGIGSLVGGALAASMLLT